MASHFRRLSFREGGQLDWHLDVTEGKRHMVLRHAPLSRHNPQWHKAGEPPCFGRDNRLKQIVDAHRNIIFLSGHTHISFNCPRGCAEYDPTRDNIYVNCGSVRPTALRPDEPLRPAEWTDGNIVQLDIPGERLEISAISLACGKRISRGYYRYPF